MHSNTGKLSNKLDSKADDSYHNYEINVPVIHKLLLGKGRQILIMMM